MSDDEAAPSFDDASKEAAYWRTKAHDYQDMLREAESSLKEFSESSKELEQEMERELAQSARDLEEARVKNDKLSQDKEEWKSKYTKSLTEHNKTLNEMSKELAQLRESHNIYKNKLRDMELDNDELENAERMVRSSLNDIEQRYNQQMEKAALLEQEVIDKSHLEEDNQRLRDEIRDLNEELAVLREREAMLSAAQSRHPTPAEPPHTMQLHENREKELTLSDLTPSRPHSSASAASKEQSPSKARPTQAPRASLMPRKSLATPQTHRDFGRTITNEQRIEGSAARTRRADLAASTRKGAVTPRSRTQVASGTSMRMMRDLLGNMNALQTRLQRATTLGPAPEADRSALPRPGSRLGSSISAGGGSSPVTTSTPSTRPRPSFDGRSSIPVASASLNRSIRRPTSRLSMGPKTHSRAADGGDDDDSPDGMPPGYIPARSMTPTAYTARARAHPSSTTTSTSTLSRGPGGATSPLDFLNTDPETRPASRTMFAARDSLSKSRRPSEAHRRNNSIQVDGSSTDERDVLARSASAMGRPRGSTISSNTSSAAASYAPSARFTPSTSRVSASVTRAVPSSSSSASSSSGQPSSELGSSLSSLAAFRERQRAQARPSSSTAGRRPASGLSSAGGPPPPSWKKKHDPLVAMEGASALRRSRSSSVGSENERY